MRRDDLGYVDRALAINREEERLRVQYDFPDGVRRYLDLRLGDNLPTRFTMAIDAEPARFWQKRSSLLAARTRLMQPDRPC